MKQSIFSIRLAPDQAQVIQSLLPHGLSLQQSNIIVQKVIQQYTKKNIQQKSQQSLKTKIKTSQQEISQTPDDELYAKSPRFWTEEQRQVFVVFNLLTRHSLLKIETELIQMFDGVEQKIMEAPVGYTVYHFWMDIRNIFKFMRQNQLNTNIIENSFNDNFNKKVLNNYKSIMGKLKHQKNNNVHFNEIKLRNIQDNMLCLSPENLETIWEMVNEHVPEHSQNELNFNLHDLPNSILSKLDKFICRRLGKKRIKSNDSGSISEAVLKTDKKQCKQVIESECNSQDFSDS